MLQLRVYNNNDNVYAAAADNWIHRVVVVLLLQVCLFSREGPPHTRGPEHNGPRRSLLSRERITYIIHTYIVHIYIYGRHIGNIIYAHTHAYTEAQKEIG